MFNYFRKGFPDERLLILFQQTEPIGIQRQEQWLIIQKLSRPFDSMNLGNLRGNNQPRHGEQLVRRNVFILDLLLRPLWIAQTRILPGRLSGLLAKSIDKKIVLARKDIVKKAETDVPVIRKGDGLLAGPLRIRVVRGL